MELADHDVLLAEGMPAESYLDTGNRALFENAGLPLVLHPDFKRGQQQRESRSCAPFVVDSNLVEPVWRRLAERAHAVGLRLPRRPDLTDEPNLRIMAGTRSLSPVVAKNGRYQFVLPRTAETMRLVSRAAHPRDAKPWAEDTRRLGVMVRRLVWRDGQDVRTVELDDPALEQGWWAVEWHGSIPCRWTDGDAMLPPFAMGVLEVEVCGSRRYPIDHLAADTGGLSRVGRARARGMRVGM